MDGYKNYSKKLNNKAKTKKEKKKEERIKKIKTKGKSKAVKVAKKTLKDNLRKKYQISLSVDGDLIYVAGSIIELDSSFGKFEGKYIIEKVIHNLSSDYTCDIEAYKI